MKPYSGDAPESAPKDVARFLSLAQNLHSGLLTEGSLQSACSALPAPNHENLEVLVRESEAAGVRQPRLGWAIAAVTDQAAEKSPDRFLIALAAWNLARACNDWVRPDRVEAAVQRAQAGFRSLGYKGWSAASDWQRYALPWTRNDYNQAAKVLTGALKEMQDEGFADLLPLCRLSLAYAQILTANFSAAEDNISASEIDFESRGDHLNLARCWLHFSSSARRQGKYKQALSYLERARDIFTQLQAPVDLAKTHFQLAYCRINYRTDYSAIEMNFKEAIEIFERSDLPLWIAQCFNGLAQIYKVIGEFSQAQKLLQAAQRIYVDYEIYGLRADNLTDNGLIDLFSGNPLTSLEYFKHSETLYNQVGARQMAARSIMYQGRAFTRLSRLQQAIQQLERAQDRFGALANTVLQAECELYLGGAWIKLDRPETAKAYISSAQERFSEGENSSFLITAHLYQAEAYLRQNSWMQAIECLQSALTLSKESGSDAQTALCHRLLGETLLSNNDLQNAWIHLSKAVEAFEAMGILNEKATAQVACGRYFALTSQYERARQTWKQVLASAEGTMPDVAWRARQGLGALAEDSGDEQTALLEYTRMADLLAKIRSDFWQPSLAGAYLRRTGTAYDRAVALAVHENAKSLSLRFIEESKSQTLLANFAGSTLERSVKAPPSLESLAIEIRWLQERLSATLAPGLRRGPQRELQQKLLENMHTYAKLSAREERQRLNEIPTRPIERQFDLSVFQDVLTRTVGENWIALDYYISETHLFGITVSPHHISAWKGEITMPIRMALHALGQLRRGTSIQDDNDFAALGEFLAPSNLPDRLSTDTYLIIAPHRILHRLPWAALNLGTSGEPVVAKCIPVVVPSLQILRHLLERAHGVQPDFHTGLLLAISEFGEKHPALPHVLKELGAMRADLSPESKLLAEREATWENLQAIADAGGLNQYSFWHIATHAFHDTVTGRLSGFALHDGELWLDQLWDLAPLPSLVTFSACSGTRSLVLEGDEHMGLATTCLAAGAQQVIGSLWDVPDEAAARLMSEFYKHLWDGNNPARAIVLAQRAAILRAEGLANWGGFFLVGAPGL